MLNYGVLACLLACLLACFTENPVARCFVAHSFVNDTPYACAGFCFLFLFLSLIASETQRIAPRPYLTAYSIRFLHQPRRGAQYTPVPQPWTLSLPISRAS